MRGKLPATLLLLMVAALATVVALNRLRRAPDEEERPVLPAAKAEAADKPLLDEVARDEVARDEKRRGGWEHFPSRMVLGECEVLETADELWVFAEETYYPPWDYRPMQSGGRHSQEVAIHVICLGPEGIKSSHRVPPDFSIHPNLGVIFGWEGSIYGYRPVTSDEPHQLFRWSDGRFEKLTPQETAELLENMDVRVASRYILDELRQISEGAGFHRLTSEKFQWSLTAIEFQPGEEFRTVDSPVHGLRVAIPNRKHRFEKSSVITVLYLTNPEREIETILNIDPESTP